MKTQTAKEIADNLYTGVVSRFGCPRVLLSDRGQPFMSKIVKAMCEILQVTQHHTTSYHPNTNGTVERQNHTLAQSLRTYCNDTHDKWPSLIPGIMMAFRRSVCATTGFSPFYMLFGQEMKIPFDIALEPKDSLPQDTRVYIDQFLSNIKMSHKIALQNEAAQKEKDKVRHDQTARVRTFAIGDLVLLKVHKFPKGQSRKLCDKATGPYRIEEIGPNYTYGIRRISDHKKQASLVNATNLQPYIRPDPTRQRLSQEDQNIPPDPDSDSDSDPEVDQDDEVTPNVDVEATQQPTPTPQQTPDPATRYQIQKVLRGRRKHGRREMYIKWLDGSCTWEPDTCFDQEMSDFINSRWTKQGKRRKSYFN
ncbi:unnamed protein product [Mytilus edulis]|nr:unnamed protein product [Mytilus edulis]